MLPLSLSVLPVMFTARERPKAMAVVVGVTFVSFPIGPILGGWRSAASMTSARECGCFR